MAELSKYHKHNGTDAPRVSYDDLLNKPSKTFAGKVFSSGTTWTLPAGWTSARISLGYYRITHNLNSSTYSAIVNVAGNATRGVAVCMMAVCVCGVLYLKTMVFKPRDTRRGERHGVVTSVC